jgi:hypothetical protein
MTDLFGQAGITREEKLAEIAREIALRQRVYPRWIADRKLTQSRADRQIAVLVAIQADYDEGTKTGALNFSESSASPATPFCIEGRSCFHWLTLEELELLGREINRALSLRRPPIGQERAA